MDFCYLSCAFAIISSLPIQVFEEGSLLFLSLSNLSPLLCPFPLFPYIPIIRLGHWVIIVYSSLNGMSYGIFVASVLIALLLRDSSYFFPTLSYTSRPAMERTENGVRLLGFYLHLLFG